MIPLLRLVIMVDDFATKIKATEALRRLLLCRTISGLGSPLATCQQGRRKLGSSRLAGSLSRLLPAAAGNTSTDAADEDNIVVVRGHRLLELFSVLPLCLQIPR